MHELDGPTIHTDELSSDEQVELAKRMISGEGGINNMERMRLQARSGDLSADPRTITTEHHGDTPEAALARVFKQRDVIQEHTDISVNVELTGKTWEFPHTTFYEIAMHLNGGHKE